MNPHLTFKGKLAFLWTSVHHYEGPLKGNSSLSDSEASWSLLQMWPIAMDVVGFVDKKTKEDGPCCFLCVFVLCSRNQESVASQTTHQNLGLHDRETAADDLFILCLLISF